MHWQLWGNRENKVVTKREFVKGMAMRLAPPGRIEKNITFENEEGKKVRDLIFPRLSDGCIKGGIIK